MVSRIEKLNELLKVEISKTLLEELDLENDVLITVVRVSVSHTLEHATAWISILPDAKTKAVFDYLNKNIYAIQQVLNDRLIMRKIPKLTFKIDETEKHAAHIEKMLENI